MTSADSDAPAAKGAAVANAQRQAATIRYIDRPDVEETFADAVSALVFDGNRFELNSRSRASMRSSTTRR